MAETVRLRESSGQSRRLPLWSHFPLIRVHRRPPGVQKRSNFSRNPKPVLGKYSVGPAVWTGGADAWLPCPSRPGPWETAAMRQHINMKPVILKARMDADSCRGDLNRRHPGHRQVLGCGPAAAGPLFPCDPHPQRPQRSWTRLAGISFLLTPHQLLAEPESAKHRIPNFLRLRYSGRLEEQETLSHPRSVQCLRGRNGSHATKYGENSSQSETANQPRRRL